MNTEFCLNFSNVIVRTKTEEGSVFVHVYANPDMLKVDRLCIHGWSVGREGRKGVGLLAQRLTDAILAGRVFGPCVIATDIHGQTYVAQTVPVRVMGRHLNADLRKLGC